jgi:AcrR family transcriptional regulator
MSRPEARRPLDRRQILGAAVDLADSVGLDATTMRRLGEALGVTPMALYKHLRDREDLIDGMVDVVVSTIPDPATGADWRQAVRSTILSARATILSHPWALGAIETRSTSSPIVLRYMDSLIGTMLNGGLPIDLVHNGMHALSTRMWGFTREVFPTPAMPEDPSARAAALASFRDEFPHIVAMATGSPHAGAGCDSDAEFEFALDLLLDGLERQRLAPTAAEPGRPARSRS